MANPNPNPHPHPNLTPKSNPKGRSHACGQRGFFRKLPDLASDRYVCGRAEVRDVRVRG
jgi:hypothetical protein